MNAPSSATSILDLALDMEANEVIIGGVRFKPCGTGTDHRKWPTTTPEQRSMRWWLYGTSASIGVIFRRTSTSG